MPRCGLQPRVWMCCIALEARQSRVIALIHRQESISLLGIPIARYIDIEDSEALLRAIRLTPDDKPIDLVLHTPGGLVLAAEQTPRRSPSTKARLRSSFHTMR